MTYLLMAWGWLKENKQYTWPVVLILLLLLNLLQWNTNGKLAGELAVCRSNVETVTLAAKAQNEIISDLQVKANARCKGSVDLVVAPPTNGWNSLMSPVTSTGWPCSEIRFKASFDGGSDNSAGATVSSTATSEVTVFPIPGSGKPDAWALWLGAGMAFDTTIWHASASLDYHRLRAYGTLDTNWAWTAGAQAKLLTWDWP